MLNTIARLVEPLLRWLVPPSGRRRRWVDRPAPIAFVASTAPVTSEARRCPVLRGEDSPLVRPYLAEYERREQVREQARRRRELWMAVYGVEFGARLIHGVVVR